MKSFYLGILLTAFNGVTYASVSPCDSQIAQAKLIHSLEQSSFWPNVVEVKMGWLKSVKPDGTVSYHVPLSVLLKSRSNSRKMNMVGGGIFDKDCNLIDSVTGPLDKTIPIVGSK